MDVEERCKVCNKAATGQDPETKEYFCSPICHTAFAQYDVRIHGGVFYSNSIIGKFSRMKKIMINYL